MKRENITINRRILIEGPSNSGKTHGAIDIARKAYIPNDNRPVLVVSIDESSCAIELNKLTDEELEQITYMNITDGDYKTLWDEIKRADSGFYSLVIIDPIHHMVKFAREYIRNSALERGVASQGGKLREIKNKDTFEIEGFDYGKANLAELRVIKKIASGHFPCIMTITKNIFQKNKGDPEEIRALADVVVELHPKSEHGTKRFVSVLKDRKTDTNTIRDDYPESLFEYLVEQRIIGKYEFNKK